MVHFRADIRPPKWEFGYWGETIDNWYRDGLPKHNYPRIPKKVSTPLASLYNAAWNSVTSLRLPSGIAVTGGAMMYPTQSFPMDNDVKCALGMESNQILVNLNLLFHPMLCGVLPVSAPVVADAPPNNTDVTIATRDVAQLRPGLCSTHVKVRRTQPASRPPDP